MTCTCRHASERRARPVAILEMAEHRPCDRALDDMDLQPDRHTSR